VARSVQRELLTEGGSGSFARAMEAAKLEQKIGVAAADRPEPAAVQPPPSAVPDGPELCDTLMPAVFACLAADLGEEIGPEVVGEATGECKAEVARLSPEDRAILRGCAGMTDCAAKIACLQQVGDEEEDEGPAGPEPPETAPPPPPPVGDDVCAAFAARTTQCYGAEMPAETVNEIAGACREAMTSAAAVIPDLGQRVAACVPKPCDDVMTCFGEAFSVGATGDTTPEGPGEAPEEVGPAAGGVGDIFGPPPDPARVAALPPETRALCAELAAKLDSCFDALIAQFGGEAMNDPATRQMIQQIRPQFRAGLENACLSAAIEGHEDFQGMAAARRCFALPCDQMIQCITALEQPSAPQEPAPGPMPGP
jgi:hypothetical protein